MVLALLFPRPVKIKFSFVCSDFKKPLKNTSMNEDYNLRGSSHYQVYQFVLVCKIYSFADDCQRPADGVQD